MTYPKTYKCAICGYERETRSEKEALEELKQEFGDIDPKDCEQVCDDCWQLIRPGNNIKLIKTVMNVVSNNS